MHRHLTSLLAIGATLGLAVSVSACGKGASDASAAGNGLTVIKVPSPSATADVIAYKIAIKHGMFKKHGIKIDEISSPAVGANQVASLLNGQLDVGVGSVVGTMQAVSRGLKIKVMSAISADNRMNGHTVWQLVVPGDSGIESFKDLGHKTVAVNSVKSVQDLGLNEAVTKAGGNYKDIEYVPLQFPDQIPALLQSKVDAVYTVEPFASTLIAQGARSIGDPEAAAFGDPHTVSLVMQASDAFLDREPDAARNFVAALQEASDYANDHPDEVRGIAIAGARATGSAAEAIKNAALPLYTTKIDDNTVDQWGSLMVKHGMVQKQPSVSDVLWDMAK